MCFVSSVLDNLLLKLSKTSFHGTFSIKVFKIESSMWIVIPVPVPVLEIVRGIVFESVELKLEKFGGDKIDCLLLEVGTE